MRLSSRDLYRLRRAHLDARHAALRLELARHRLGEMLLELERRYGLLGGHGSIDIHTGELSLPQSLVRKEDHDQPGRHSQSGPG